MADIAHFSGLVAT